MPPKKSLSPALRHPKLRGEWAEMLFMARCTALGFRVAKPITDCYRWDLVVEHDLGFHRVQVKSTTVCEKGSYRCVYFSSSKYRYYSPEDFDFLAAYVVPEDVWFIIPSDMIATCSLTLDARQQHPHSRYEKYREAWDLLKQPGRFNIHACADLSSSVPPIPCSPDPRISAPGNPPIPSSPDSPMFPACAYVNWIEPDPTQCHPEGFQP